MQTLFLDCYPEAAFGGFSDQDGTVRFYQRVNAILQPRDVVLDVGCGRGAGAQEDPVAYKRALRTLKGKCARVIGLDVDAAAQANPGLDEFRLLDTPRWPVDDAQADLVLADFVIEHVRDPQAFFAECWRVLRPGGHLCVRTANRLGYVGIIARLVPERLHRRVLRVAQKERQAEDVFPTVYAANTVPALRRVLRQAGFRAVVYGVDAEPTYLGFSPILYRLGMWVHRLTPGMFKTCIFAFGRKEGAAGEPG